MMIDCIVQYTEETGSGAFKYDRHRGLSFALFGALYLGVCQVAASLPCTNNLTPLITRVFSLFILQWSIYGRIFPWVCRKLVPHSPAAAMSLQVVLDQIVVFPAVYFPLFYGIQGAVDPRSSVAEGMGKWRQNLSEDCSAALVWAPVQVFNFGVLPVHWRAPFISGAGFLWTAFLSATRGGVKSSASLEAGSASADGVPVLETIAETTDARRSVVGRSSA